MADSRLRHERKRPRARESPEQEAVLQLWRTNEQVQNRFGRLFRRFGLTSSQYNVLRILRGNDEPMPCLEVAGRLVQAVPAITGLIDRLESQGWVRRKRCTEDRRVVYVEITRKALELLERMERPVAELHRELVGHLSRAELKQLSGLLAKARARVEESVPEE
jgi:DNA-binding MarR family transcriptional regulator